MGFEIGVFCVRSRLHLAPVAVEDVLLRVDQPVCACHGGFIYVVLGHRPIIQAHDIRAVGSIAWNRVSPIETTKDISRS
jgi:hypothetical protein